MTKGKRKAPNNLTFPQKVALWDHIEKHWKWIIDTKCSVYDFASKCNKDLGFPVEHTNIRNLLKQFDKSWPVASPAQQNGISNAQLQVIAHEVYTLKRELGQHMSPEFLHLIGHGDEVEVAS